MTTDISEKGLETLIVDSLINKGGYLAGLPGDYNRNSAVDLVKLASFLNETQLQVAGVHFQNVDPDFACFPGSCGHCRRTFRLDTHVFRIPFPSVVGFCATEFG